MHLEQQLRELTASVAVTLDQPSWLFFECDTTCDEAGVLRPFVYVSAFTVDLHRGLARAAEFDDLGFLEDELTEVSRSEARLFLSPLFPRWPDDFAEGERVLAQLLSTLVLAQSWVHARGCFVRWAGQTPVRLGT